MLYEVITQLLVKQSCLQAAILLAQLRQLQGMTHRAHQAVILDSLDEVVVGPQLHAADRQLDLVATGEDDHRQQRGPLGRLGQDLDAAAKSYNFV